MFKAKGCFDLNIMTFISSKLIGTIMDSSLPVIEQESVSCLLYITVLLSNQRSLGQV